MTLPESELRIAREGAEYCLEQSARFPWDASDRWKDYSDGFDPPAAQDWAHAAARGIVCHLRNRVGLGAGFEGIDEVTREMIVNALAEIIRLAHERDKSGL